MTLARQWTGVDARFQETWFIEALFSADRGLWVRYVLNAARGCGEVWALVVTRGGVVASHREEVPLADVRGPLFEHGDNLLRRDRATGRCGPIAWDLALDDLGAHHRHVPRLLPLLGLGRTYDPAIQDLRVQGELTFAGETWNVRRGMGVLGHLWGGRSRIRGWAWAHCNAFRHEGVVFEGLSADLGRSLTSVVLHAHGHTWGFSRVRDLLRTRSDVHGTRWTFEARRGDVLFAGEVTLNPARAATVRYARPDQDALYCTNSRFAEIRVVLRDPGRGVDHDLRSREAAFELVGPEPRGEVLLG